MKWVKQEGGEWHRWVCSRCGTLLVRVHDDHPLPEKCPACGETEELENQAKDNPPIFRNPKPKWILKNITLPDRVTLECSHCGWVVTAIGEPHLIPDAVRVCRKCRSVMGGLDDG